VDIYTNTSYKNGSACHRGRSNILIGARAGLVVREVVPRIAVLTVVLAHRAPLAFAEVGRPPLFPRTSFSRASSRRFCSAELRICTEAASIRSSCGGYVTIKNVSLP
jgi:hypothetical protein